MALVGATESPTSRCRWKMIQRVSLNDAQGLHRLRSKLDVEEAKDQVTLRRQYESHRSGLPHVVRCHGERQAKGIVKLRALLKLMRADVSVGNLDEAHMGLTERSGWLERESPGWFSNWAPCWVTLRGKQLRWYASPEDKSPLGLLDFDLLQCEVLRGWDRVSQCTSLPRSYGCDVALPFFGALFLQQPAAFQVRARGTERGLVLRAGSFAEGDAWAEALERRINHNRHVASEDSRGECVGRADGVDLSQVSRASPSSAPWWKVTKITPAKFSLLAKTGDILLFRSPGAVPRLIRTTSGGRFDHVALVLRLEGGRIGLLEATGNAGVSLCTWDEFVAREWFLIYPEIALRRVTVQRTEERITALQKWAIGVIGKPYGLSMSMLMQRKSLAAGATHEAFFCSMLVAEALKVLEVIPHGKSSTQYWPANFEASHRPPIETIEGTSLDDEMVIDFGSATASSATASTECRVHMQAVMTSPPRQCVKPPAGGGGGGGGG
mmetsp:Transcript_65235/g.187847  ORF Transcript_65235/g.187847 Transcript_65235/m.187847 type:complete len:495 (-) Transcript_65235:227-1711(-)